ncbi:NADPH oxidase [Russula vinacea]|nr:NADPH oxidase [Russula vinacea]
MSQDGLDFSDGAQFPPDDPDMKYNADAPQPAHLQRNKTERRRLQGLQRFNTTTAPMTKWDRWMINEGGKRLFFSAWVLLHLLVADNLTTARATFGITFSAFILAFPLSRPLSSIRSHCPCSRLVLHVDVIFILLPVCRNFISLLRRTPLNHIIPFDKNLTFHKATAWSIVIGTAVHIGAHMVNFYKLALADTSAKTGGAKVVAFLNANFATGPGATGWIMTVCLGIMLHGMFCMIKPDRPPYCSWNSIGVFWRYWLVGGVIWIGERVLREVRSRHRTYISKVIQHPSNVMEIQIKKERTTTQAGQYIFICCPEISYFQWHPFTLTSAPEEDYISVHIRVVGDFTRELAKALGCDFDKKSGEKSEKGEKGAGGKVVGTDVTPPVNRILPRIMVDGPFGSASEDFLKYETVLLVGAGIGVTPFASILKSIWYRMNNFNNSKPTRLSKVYFTWVIRDFGSAEWFHSLLHAIEEQDVQNRIEINIYLTAKIQEDDMTNIIVQDVGADKDAITSLRAPTHFGRPNWDRVFPSIANKHPETDVGVFFCGPPVLSRQLHQMCNKYSTPGGTRFFFGKVLLGCVYSGSTAQYSYEALGRNMSRVENSSSTVVVNDSSCITVVTVRYRTMFPTDHRITGLYSD